MRTPIEALVARAHAVERARADGGLDGPGDDPGDFLFAPEVTLDGAGRELLEDALRSSALAATLAAGAGPNPARVGDLRARFGAWVAGVVREPAEEARARSVGVVPSGGFPASVLLAADPDTRDRAYDRWAEHEDALEPARAGADDALASAAPSWGEGATLTSLADATALAPRAALRDGFERVAVAPIDEAVASVAGARGDDREGARFARVLADADVADRGRFARVLEDLVRSLGLDPDLSIGDRSAATSRAYRVPGGACVSIGSVGGVSGLAEALEAFGIALRAAALAEMRGDVDVARTDPAFDVAAGVVFRRLVLSGPWATDTAMPDRARWIDRARFEEACRPRVAWARLDRALAGRSGRDAVDEVWWRAAGRPPTPTERALAGRAPLEAGDGLRGTVYGLLLEERLCTAHGRRWYRDRSAGKRLRELWDGEVEETAETLAAAAGLGRMEPTPVLDRCRP